MQYAYNISLTRIFLMCVKSFNWVAGLLINSLRWRHNERDSVSNHQPHDCLLNRLFRRKSKKTSKLRVTGLCVGNSPGTGEFPAQMASYAVNVSIWWRHHVPWQLIMATVFITVMSLATLSLIPLSSFDIDMTFALSGLYLTNKSNSDLKHACVITFKNLTCNQRIHWFHIFTKANC